LLDQHASKLRRFRRSHDGQSSASREGCEPSKENFGLTRANRFENSPAPHRHEEEEAPPSQTELAHEVPNRLEVIQGLGTHQRVHLGLERCARSGMCGGQRSRKTTIYAAQRIVALCRGSVDA
jgi:hypothetical protein